MTEKLDLKCSTSDDYHLVADFGYDDNCPFLDLSMYENETYRACILLDTNSVEKLNKLLENYLEEYSDFNQDFKTKVDNLFKSISAMLVVKNKGYGDSALNPINVFSKADSTNVISQQIDHKLSRIKNSSELSKNDVGDLIGYLTLLCIDKKWTNFDKE